MIYNLNTILIKGEENVYPAMDEQTIMEFRNRAQPYFQAILIKEGYDIPRAADLGFYIAKILEDALSLLEDVETNNGNSDTVLDYVHMLYANEYAFSEGDKLLMYRDQR